MEKKLLLFGASVATAMGSALLVLVLALTVSNNVFAQTAESCSGGCTKTVNNGCTDKATGACQGTNCGCTKQVTLDGACPCGRQS